MTEVKAITIEELESLVSGEIGEEHELDFGILNQDLIQEAVSNEWFNGQLFTTEDSDSHGNTIVVKGYYKLEDGVVIDNDSYDCGDMMFAYVELNGKKIL